MLEINYTIEEERGVLNYTIYFDEAGGSLDNADNVFEALAMHEDVSFVILSEDGEGIKIWNHVRGTVTYEDWLISQT